VQKRNLILLLIATLIITIGAVLFLSKNRADLLPSTSSSDKVSWTFDGASWQVRGTPPDCPDPLILPTPVDMKLVTGILYPGQERGGDYKPHGGFRFDNRTTNDIEVRAVMEGSIFKASKYLESGERQVAIWYVNDCGIMVMHDHLLVLSLKLEQELGKIPQGAEGDSRTTFLEPIVLIKQGEILASEIGQKNYLGHLNIGVDYGLYDLRRTNGIDYTESFRAKHPNINEYGTYGVCWFDYLKREDATVVRSLPAVGNAGKTSDYCR
jgi:hypothetical protein